MESFVEGVGMFFIAIGGIAAILAALCFYGGWLRLHGLQQATDSAISARRKA